MSISVFVENPAGLAQKHHYDEERCILRSVSAVSRPYPYPYGFVLDALAADGDNLDCFLLTGRELQSGDVVECEVLGLMEQWEDGITDHNLLARPLGESAELTASMRDGLVDFVAHVFDHIPGKRVRAGRFLGASEGRRHLAALRRR